jgi:hypothetical protein
MEHGLRNGKGTMTVQVDGRELFGYKTFEGTFRDDAMVQGTLEAEGWTYVGEFSATGRHGAGKLMVQDSGYLLTFDGAWKNNRATEGTVKMQSATSTLTIKGSFDTKAAGEAAEAAEALRESAEAAEALLQLETTPAALGVPESAPEKSAGAGLLEDEEISRAKGEEKAEPEADFDGAAGDDGSKPAYFSGEVEATRVFRDPQVTMTFKGKMEDGLPCGEGHFEATEGPKTFSYSYDGGFLDGMRHGVGKLHVEAREVGGCCRVIPGGFYDLVGPWHQDFPDRGRLMSYTTKAGDKRKLRFAYRANQPGWGLPGMVRTPNLGRLMPPTQLLDCGVLGPCRGLPPCKFEVKDPITENIQFLREPESLPWRSWLEHACKNLP